MGVVHVRASTHETLGALQFLDGSIGHALGDISPSQHDVGGAEVRIEIERLSKLGDGFVVATGEVVDQAEVLPCVRRHRVQIARALGERERLFVPSPSRPDRRNRRGGQSRSSGSARWRA